MTPPKRKAEPVMPLADARRSNQRQPRAAQVQPVVRGAATDSGETAVAPTEAVASTRAPKFSGSLSIRSEPVGARVSVDGRVVGSTPLLLHAVPAGSRVIRIESDGYHRWSSAARVVANQRTSIVASLQRRSSN